ncbi:hypothetical protein GCM10019016_024640 [Streptomyces prasinosporus]|uniref:Uncharacterized protein n=1 Tax=Streptomyces prasinosporus TaxID=68256 RepID=A0ABP6TLE8_9ACTN|nr:hypothetical protein GCM10010332_27920 [Streptomyces albogriseolus]
MASAATALAAHGARVVARIVQRQGVSDGGARKLSPPYSSRTPLTYGKVREVASARDQADADAVIFTVSLTERQRRTMTDMLGRPAVSISDILTAETGRRFDQIQTRPYVINSAAYLMVTPVVLRHFG